MLLGHVDSFCIRQNTKMDCLLRHHIIVFLQVILLSTQAFIPSPRRHPRRPLLFTTASRADDDDDDDDAGRVLEVCLSPGCLADGARATLFRLRALAAALPSEASSAAGRTTSVRGGACCSLCGSGPVVTERTGKGGGGGGVRKFRNVSSDEKLLQVLSSSSAAEATASAPSVGNDDSTGTSRPASDRQLAILRALDVIDEAREAAESDRDYRRASALYQHGLDLGTSTVYDDVNDDDDSPPSSGHRRRRPIWLVQAKVGHARCLLLLLLLQAGPKDDGAAAVDASQSAVDWAPPPAGIGDDDQDDQDEEAAILVRYESLEVLQQALEAAAALPANVRARKDLARRERAALEELLALPEPTTRSSTVQQNKRRSLGFRLQRLQREVK